MLKLKLLNGSMDSNIEQYEYISSRPLVVNFLLSASYRRQFIVEMPRDCLFP